MWPGVARTSSRRSPKAIDVVLHQIAVGALGAARRRQHDLAAGALLQQPGAGDVIGMDMGFERRDELEAQLVDQRRVAPHLLEHRVDQHRRAGWRGRRADRCRSRIADRTIDERSASPLLRSTVGSAILSCARINEREHTMPARINPPFRADHVGSLIRPPRADRGAYRCNRRASSRATRCARSRTRRSATWSRCRSGSACKRSPTANCAATIGATASSRASRLQRGPRSAAPSSSPNIPARQHPGMPVPVVDGQASAQEADHRGRFRLPPQR